MEEDNNMELIKPCEKYFTSYTEAINEYEENNVTEYSFFAGNQEYVLKRIADYESGANLPSHYVKATYLWLIDNDEFIGEVSIRHTLTDDLLRFGGNIGYGIRCSYHNKGFGTKILELALNYAKTKLNLKKVLVTCNDINVASSRVIEKNGGKLQDKVKNIIDGIEILTRRYWIET